MDNLPTNLKRTIYALVDESNNAKNLAKVSKEFYKIGKDVLTESMERGLTYYKRHGKHGDEASIAAILTSESKSMKLLRKFLRVCLTAYKEHRLIESFLRWKDDHTVTFYSVVINIMYRYKQGYTKKNKKTIRAILSASVRERNVRVLHKRGYYKPKQFMDFIVMYVYNIAVEKSFESLKISS